MSHFAKVEDGIVTEVIVAEQDVIDSGLFGDPSLWIQTSYNSKLGTRRNPDNQDLSLDETPPLRGNFAGVGYIYDSVNDVFYPPKPFPSWTIDSSKWTWFPPLPQPNDGKNYNWDEETISWVEVQAVSEEPPTIPPPDPLPETRPE